MKKTFSITPKEVTRTWYVIDASSAPLGRVASAAAKLLIGKHKPTYTPHIDGGDYVIVVNGDNLVVTGNKDEDKKYYRHSGYPGGITETTLRDQKIKDSSRILEAAIKGMLPKNKLQDERMARLKLYAGSDHAHAPQQPVVFDIKENK